MKTLKLLLLLAILSTGSSAHARTDVVHTVKTNGSWGTWGAWQYCPKGSFASGYSMKVEASRGPDGDDTAVNGIKLYCTNVKGTRTSNITSKVGPWGTWREGTNCPVSSFIQSVAMKYEKHATDIDDTGTTSIRFKCTNGALIQASGTMKWGTWGPFIKCPSKELRIDTKNKEGKIVTIVKMFQTAVNGIRTRVERSLGDGDDTALNGVEYSCAILYK